MRTAVRKLLVGVAGLVLEALSVSKEQVVAQRQQVAALRRVHKCERELYAASASGSPDAIESARMQVQDARHSFDNLFNKPLQ